jgi:hypothetical protein
VRHQSGPAATTLPIRAGSGVDVWADDGLIIRSVVIWLPARQWDFAAGERHFAMSRELLQTAAQQSLWAAASSCPTSKMSSISDIDRMDRLGSPVPDLSISSSEMGVAYPGMLCNRQYGALEATLATSPAEFRPYLHHQSEVLLCPKQEPRANRMLTASGCASSSTVTGHSFGRVIVRAVTGARRTELGAKLRSFS